MTVPLYQSTAHRGCCRARHRSTPLACGPSHRSHPATHSRCPHSGGQEDAAMRAPLAIAFAGATLIAGGACSTQHPKPVTVAAIAAVSRHHDVPEPPTTTTVAVTTTRPQPAVAMTWPKAPHKAKSHGCTPRSMSQIAQDENGGSYTGKNPHSTASGKYQVLDSTWGGYGGYAHAQDAPPDVQEKQAGELYAQWQSGKIPNPWAASGC